MELIGLIIGNRNFFPSNLCIEARERLIKVLKEEGITAVILNSDETPYGTVETFDDAKKCAKLFAQNKEKMIGILVSLPNFGDERSVAESIRQSGLNLPVLIHAFQDNLVKLGASSRRDSFCGKISVCNNLFQFGIKYSLTSSHTVDPESEKFRIDFRRFVQTCRIVNGLKNVRFGQIGIRPANFATVRYSEKLLERHNITVEPLDLSEIIARANSINDNEIELKNKVLEIQDYVLTSSVPAKKIVQMAKLGVAIDRFVRENDLSGIAIQCWTSLQLNFGVMPCTLMSMLGNKLIPSACETDIPGLVGMYALSLASQSPSALLDWNNNYDENSDKSIVFHCSNIPKIFFGENAEMSYNSIIANAVGKDKSFGTVVGIMKPQKVTYCRVSTDEYQGRLKTYIGEGNMTNDKVKTFGGYGTINIPNFQELLKFICKNGFEHHVAVTSGEVSNALNEAFSNYFDYETYHHH
ncbi:MAG TPA: L-fucose/L-arabinose isomerase family protein [Bacteroidales bacterium]|nr:L-fucose/L-arabinose isomerase family protein [Bacteroidales bacterium]